MTAGHTPCQEKLEYAQQFLAREDTGVLLDLDGTLIDSEPIHQAGFVSYFARRGWDVEPNVLVQFIGRRAAEVFASIDGPWAGEDPDVLTAEIIAELLSLESKPAPFPSVRRVLETLLAAGKPVCIVTSANLIWTRRAIDIFDLPPPLCSELKMVTTEDCVAGKPDPMPYQNGSAVLGLPPRLCLAVEDSPAGIRSAHAAGVAVVVAVDTTHSHSDLVAAAPDLIVDGLGALLPTSRT